MPCCPWCFHAPCFTRAVWRCFEVEWALAVDFEEWVEALVDACFLVFAWPWARAAHSISAMVSSFRIGKCKAVTSLMGAERRIIMSCLMLQRHRCVYPSWLRKGTGQEDITAAWATALPDQEDHILPALE